MASKVLAQLVKWLEIRILLKWGSFLAVFLGLELQVDRFYLVHLIVGIAYWEHRNRKTILFSVFLASHNPWMMTFHASDIFLILAIYEIRYKICLTPKILLFLYQYFDIENTKKVI